MKKEKVQYLKMVHGLPKWVNTGYKTLADARRINPTENPNFYRIKHSPTTR
jgi:hypothetical protein